MLQRPSSVHLMALQMKL